MNINNYVGSRLGGIPSMGQNTINGPDLMVPSAGGRSLVTGIQSDLDYNPLGQTTQQKGNKPIAIKYQLLPWPDMIHQELFEGMIIAANSVKSGIPAHLTAVAPLGYINAQSIKNFNKHAVNLNRLLPQINQSWYESPLRAIFEKHRDLDLSRLYYGPSSLKNAQNALDEHRQQMRINNNSGMQEIEFYLLKELDTARENQTGRETFYNEFDESVRSHRKNEYSTCTVRRLISQWKILGAVLSTVSNKHTQLIKNTLDTRTVIGVSAGGFTNTFNVWSNHVMQGTYLWFVVKPQETLNAELSSPVFIPWESLNPYDKSEPPLQVRKYKTAQGLWEYGPAILYGMIAEKPQMLSKSDHQKSVAMGYAGQSWEEIRGALAILDMLKVQQIKNRNVYF